MSAPMRRSPLHRLEAEAGALFDTDAGWELAIGYGDDERERARLRGSVGLADVTARGKVDVRGDVSTALASVNGGAGVARIAPDWALVLTQPGGEDAALEALEAAGGDRAMVTDVTHLYAGFAIAGPLLDAAVARLTSWDPRSLEAGGATGAPVAGVRAVLVRRATTIPVLDVYVGAESSRYAWETMLGVVERLGGGPVGWAALHAEGCG